MTSALANYHIHPGITHVTFTSVVLFIDVCCLCTYAHLRVGVRCWQEDDDDINSSKFFDSLYSLELDTGRWHQVALRSVL